MSPPLPLRFVLSADAIERLPASSKAEIAVVGRSNVGKSSLINALGNNHKLAVVAKAPGRTRLLNCFALDENVTSTLIDCPGYGYAAVPKGMRAGWEKMIERYLLERPQLKRILVLVDGEIGPTKLDAQMFAWLDANNLPYAVIATKHDKVKSSKREKRKSDLAEGCGVPQSEVIWVSAAKGTGIDRLRDLARLWLAESPVP
jgi:GTP-binding protein